MAKALTNDEKREIKEKTKYILTAMDGIGKNGDAYCTDEHLFRASKTVRPSLTGQRYRTDKALLLQAGFLHQEGYHLYARRTWDYEVTAAEQLADILKDPALPAMEIPKELRAGDILLCEQQREAIELALNSRLSIILGGAGCGIEAIVYCFRERNDAFEPYVVAAPTGKAARATSPSAPGSRHARSTAHLGKARMQTFWTPFHGTASDWSSSMRHRWCL